MQKKIALIGLAAGVLLAGSGLVTGSVLAETTNQNQNVNTEVHPGMPKMDPAQKAAIDKAIQDGNYEEWKTAVSQNGQHPAILDKITQDNFAQFSQMHKLMREAKEKMQQAAEIGQQLQLSGPMGKGDFKRGFGGHMGFRKGGRMGMPDMMNPASTTQPQP